MFVVLHRKFFYALTALILAGSLGSLLAFGLPLGVDFSGGSLAEVRYGAERPAHETLLAELRGAGFASLSVRPVGEDGDLIRTRALSEPERRELVAVIGRAAPGASLERFTTVGPVVGTELRRKAAVALALVLLAVTLYVAFVFRKVSRPVASWKYGAIVIVALLHDVLVPVGIFALLGRVAGVEVDALFVTALLAVMGYSINDTIVVFDRVRENLRRREEENRREDFELTVGKSVNQTFARSVNTSLTTALALLAIFFVGPESTQHFSLALLAGVVAGAYSSICLAAPLLVTLERSGRRA